VAFATPEEAARVGTPERYVRVVGVVIRGDEAIVAQVMNADGYPAAYEIETATCYRKGSGWVHGSSGNFNASVIVTGEGVGTAVLWLEAPPASVAGRFRLGMRNQVATVENGFALAVFDDVPIQADGWPVEWPTLDEWLTRK
jgi:hypothetical protein